MPRQTPLEFAGWIWDKHLHGALGHTHALLAKKIAARDAEIAAEAARVERTIVERAARLIEWMAGYIGKMAPGLYHTCYADLNEHWLAMQARGLTDLLPERGKDDRPAEQTAGLRSRVRP